MAKQVSDIRLGKRFPSAQSNEHLRKYSDATYQDLMSNNFAPTMVHLDFQITKEAGWLLTITNIQILKE